MYKVSSLPVTGSGASLMVASQGSSHAFLATLFVVLAFWTIIGAIKTTQRIIPKTEI